MGVVGSMLGLELFGKARGSGGLGHGMTIEEGKIRKNLSVVDDSRHKCTLVRIDPNTICSANAAREEV
jgi:hypothetical protein